MKNRKEKLSIASWTLPEECLASQYLAQSGEGHIWLPASSASLPASLVDLTEFKQKCNMGWNGILEGDWHVAHSPLQKGLGKIF